MSEPETPTNGVVSARLPGIKLDPTLYNPSGEELDFLKDQTKIEDEEELKQHVIAVQTEAWNVFHYKCIQSFGFTRLKISRLPAYPDLLELGNNRPDAIFLDFACCCMSDMCHCLSPLLFSIPVGNDARKAIADGYPMENVIASDLQAGFWEAGHKLFRSTPETFPVHFIQGSVFDPNHIAPTPPHYSPPSTPRPDLSTLTLLNSLQGHVSAIHVSLFFHLFRKEEQIIAAQALASLLSPLPGSMIFGTHSSRAVSEEIKRPVSGDTVYNFNPEDWCALWDGNIFRKGSVSVEARLIDNAVWRGKEYDNITEETKRRGMVWSVKRI
ncbi:uncharacterized protein FOMMEDRAFT_78949 [Fomitiporia mediterranea MF3/22]|uniref:uncharacterized protein n=1 Tax=Fomitiporia mediterranea (strain MF3/22) TaxID=694068 RepID=UPI00044079EC|nr:uncharacterized protein FOMMEDRAFT_78949 [Fomitiporia mediterranea MF3/22]EJD05462.1 hypothetical protein FOMMEDRAFT_78949 [Fomitiporia mediterranea MF3/22]